MDIVRRNARMCPDAAAIDHAHDVWSHAELAEHAGRLAMALHGLGLRYKDRFSVLSMNNPEFLAAYVAAAGGGFVLHTLNVHLALTEMAWILDDVSPCALIFEAQYVDTVAQLRPQLAYVKHFICIGARERPEWAISYQDLLEAADDKVPGFTQGREDDHGCLMYTSGTTGKPKGVLHANRSILRICEVVSSELALGGDTRLLAIAPLFHMGAATLALAALFRGGCAVLHRAFNAGEVIRTIENKRINAIHMVPTMVQAVLDAPEFGQYELGSLRMLMYAAAPMPLALARRAVAVFGPILYNGYGQTEINLITLLKPDQHILNGDTRQMERLASVGQAHWQSEVRIVGEDGHTCQAGEIGEVIARSETAMVGYWNNVAATCDTIRDGWIHTGDIGYLDDEGYLFLIDRKKDVIISGGENIYSREVEDVLAMHPAVLECAVIGIPDVRWGEAVKAFVVLADGMRVNDEELIAWCRRSIAGYKCPKQIEFIDALPRLSTGKVSKQTLRIWMRAMSIKDVQD